MTPKTYTPLVALGDCYAVAQGVTDTQLSDAYTCAVASLLFETGAVESRYAARRQCGFERQLDGGAVSYWQMERIWIDAARGVLQRRALVHDNFRECVWPGAPVPVSWIHCITNSQIHWMLTLPGQELFACAIARAGWLAIGERVPATVAGRAEYWKKYYNSFAGKGTVEGYIDAARDICYPCYTKRGWVYAER